MKQWTGHLTLSTPHARAGSGQFSFSRDVPHPAFRMPHPVAATLVPPSSEFFRCTEHRRSKGGIKRAACPLGPFESLFG
jgi:hypothetical protein